jgi:hypothetical protein
MSLEAAIQTISNKGFTERQARFLMLVARHSGVCVMRQYSTFAGIVFGQKTRKFFAQLVERGYASTYDCAHNRARLFHLRHRELYETIGDADSRLRRAPAVSVALERVMLLDAMLVDREIVWLATPAEKVAHFTTHTGIPLEDLPLVVARNGDPTELRHFPDRLPIGIRPDGRTVLICLALNSVRDDFRSFLQRHAGMLAALPAWTVRVVLPADRAAAVEEFEKTGRSQLTGTLSTATWAELRWYFERLKMGHRDGGTEADRLRFQRDRSAFEGPKYSVLYRAWLQDGERTLTLAASTKIADALASGAGGIQPFVLPHSYAHLSPLAAIA